MTWLDYLEPCSPSRTTWRDMIDLDMDVRDKQGLENHPANEPGVENGSTCE